MHAMLPHCRSERIIPIAADAAKSSQHVKGNIGVAGMLARELAADDGIMDRADDGRLLNQRFGPVVQIEFNLEAVVHTEFKGTEQLEADAVAGKVDNMDFVPIIEGQALPVGFLADDDAVQIDGPTQFTAQFDFYMHDGVAGTGHLQGAAQVADLRYIQLLVAVTGRAGEVDEPAVREPQEGGRVGVAAGVCFKSPFDAGCHGHVVIVDDFDGAVIHQGGIGIRGWGRIEKREQAGAHRARRVFNLTAKQGIDDGRAYQQEQTLMFPGPGHRLADRVGAEDSQQRAPVEKRCHKRRLGSRCAKPVVWRLFDRRQGVKLVDADGLTFFELPDDG
ncbi:hypothetical protein DESC_480089 [Desulfosarcina cetonica]|nr:hypothetical protein DESC_480089 [Desulfosarcina cetonica]